MRLRTIAALAACLAAVPAGAGAQDGRFAYVGTSLFGDQEVGHEAAGEDASGDFTAELDLTAGKICYALEVDGLDTVTAAHLHEGEFGKNGPPMVTLQLMGEDGEDVCTAVDKALLAKIAKNKADYYVNVHTEAFPDGAIRGQLND